MNCDLNFESRVALQEWAKYNILCEMQLAAEYMYISQGMASSRSLDGNR